VTKDIIYIMKFIAHNIYIIKSDHSSLCGDKGDKLVIGSSSSRNPCALKLAGCCVIEPFAALW
jgi:hypothetical protein